MQITEAEKTEGKNIENEKQVKRDTKEFILAIMLAVIVALMAMSNLLWESNKLYPYAYDSLGHMAKVDYITESIGKGILPAWFPYWYEGAATVQYYPPLSYCLMVPLHVLSKNIIVTYKIFCFLMLFIGNVGVWHLGRKTFGAKRGLLAIPFYGFQLFLLRSLFFLGVLAQAPIFALSPWFIEVVLSLAQKLRRSQFVACTLLTTALLLSHAMHIYMVCLCIMLILFLFVLMRKISFKNYFVIGLGMACGVALASFWWFVGVTGFENPGVPQLLEEAGVNCTATLKWFTTREGVRGVGLVFSPVITLLAIGALPCYIKSSKKHQKAARERDYVLFSIFLTFFTLVFSFGQHLPTFKMIPLYKSLVPGRILSLTCITAALLGEYTIYYIISWCKGQRRRVGVIIGILLVGICSYSLNPYREHYEVFDLETAYKAYMEDLGKGDAFSKGRYKTIGAVHSAEAFFPIRYHLNCADGYNIEGTPHNQRIWTQNVALAADAEEALLKDLLFWNVRSVLILPQYEKMQAALEEKGYTLKQEINHELLGKGYLYTSDAPSSYFLIDKRNGFIVGVGSTGLSIEFPYLVEGKDANLAHYDLEELEKYALVYLCEPEINNEKQGRELEEMISHLVQKGVNVIIEPTKTKNTPLFGVTTRDSRMPKEARLVREASGEELSDVENIDFIRNKGWIRELFGLDEVYYSLVSNEGRMKNNALGVKYIEGGKVYFVGMHLSQYLKATAIRNEGYQEGKKYPYAIPVKKLLSQLLEKMGANTDYSPGNFEVDKVQWNEKGVSFCYENEKETEVTLSLTYTPRWHGLIDGEELKVKEKEDLVVLKLPAGKHQVALNYGVTLYGYIGYGLSGLTLLLLLLYLKNFESWNQSLGLLGSKLGAYLEFKKEGEWKKNE